MVCWLAYPALLGHPTPLGCPFKPTFSAQPNFRRPLFEGATLRFPNRDNLLLRGMPGILLSSAFALFSSFQSLRACLMLRNAAPCYPTLFLMNLDLLSGLAYCLRYCLTISIQLVTRLLTKLLTFPHPHANSLLVYSYSVLSTMLSFTLVGVERWIVEYGD